MISFQLDIPFSVSFYRWLLGQESTLTLRDLNHVAPDVYRTISRLQMLIQQKRMIENDSTISDVEKYKKVVLIYTVNIFFILHIFLSYIFFILYIFYLTFFFFNLSIFNF